MAHHIIDPRTGYPSSGILSVSVFAKSAELADALATSIFVMGKDVGLHLVNQLDQIECIIVDDENRVSKSKGIQLCLSGLIRMLVLHCKSLLFYSDCCL